MKVYIVNWFSAEKYSDHGGPLKAFSSKEKAQEFVDSHQNGPYDVDIDNWNEGYFVSSIIDELEIEE